MARLIYAMFTSLDGYVADADGSFDWAEPDAAVHGFVNDLERPIGTYLYGRRMYEIMTGWETDPGLAERSAVARDFAQIWQAADKIVYSTTLQTASTRRTRIERNFDPERVARIKQSAAADLSIGGPDLAASAIAAGLVDEWHLFVVPIIVGGGKPALPRDGRIRLDLLDERRFAGGMIYLRYRSA